MHISPSTLRVRSNEMKRLYFESVAQTLHAATPFTSRDLGRSAFTILYLCFIIPIVKFKVLLALSRAL